MAWIVLALEDTLMEKVPPEMGGDGQTRSPIEGAQQFAQQLAAEGHRLTVYTSSFAPMPESTKQRLKAQIEQELAQWGFPPMEVWTGTTKPDADIFIGANHITYDGEWGLVLSQLQIMLEERGLVPPPMQFDQAEAAQQAPAGGEDPQE